MVLDLPEYIEAPELCSSLSSSGIANGWTCEVLECLSCGGALYDGGHGREGGMEVLEELLSEGALSNSPDLQSQPSGSKRARTGARNNRSSFGKHKSVKGKERAYPRGGDIFKSNGGDDDHEPSGSVKVPYRAPSPSESVTLSNGRSGSPNEATLSPEAAENIRLQKELAIKNEVI